MKKLFSAIVLSALSLPSLALAQDITITDPYARSSSKMASSGAAFMVIANAAETADTLVEARSDVAKKVELHTHIEGDDGVMQMRPVEGGIEVPAGGETVLKRGGLHVMFMGLNAPFEQGETLDVTLVFENAGEVELQIPVDLERKPMHGEMDHSKMDHGKMDHSEGHGEGHGEHGKTETSETSSN